TILAQLQQEMLSRHTKEVMSYKDFLRQLVSYRATRADQVLEKIDALPEGDALCHGDWHPGNILMSNTGKHIIIDFMNVCYGPWQYDVARSYFLLSKGSLPEEMVGRERLKVQQKQLGTYYLEKMCVQYNEIAEFLEVIWLCRAYE
ncbi:MAG: aminoglycoside phosphotransferase family protein, partial [Fibrobacter sp.]|nr:aminoglycoside phosphotransferase family protein [Fibrobacter sp.]